MAEQDTAAQEMTAAVAAMASFQQVTQQADVKAGIMVTVHVGLTAVVGTQIGQVGGPTPPEPVAVLFWLASLAYALTFTVSGYLLVRVIRPRTGQPSGTNRFSLDIAAHSGTDGGQLAAQAWATADAIARIATVKNRYTARAVTWVAAMVLAAVAWLVLAGMTR
ncbi:hypothetical protein [Streptomyces sp. 7N604]|uniref:hypothetical protein n=1 Tax=Streptomyces sp. 7N604 TaxID=3457415 RepID=UPI003FD0D752